MLSTSPVENGSRSNAATATFFSNGFRNPGSFRTRRYCKPCVVASSGLCQDSFAIYPDSNRICEIDRDIVQVHSSRGIAGVVPGHFRGLGGCGAVLHAYVVHAVYCLPLCFLFHSSFSGMLTLLFSEVYMPSYELAQMQLGVRLGAKQLLGMRHVIAGSIAGLCGSIVKVPMDVVKKRLQAGLYPNIGVAMTSIAGEGSGILGGVRQFYTGWSSSIIYDIPYNAVQFTVLENVKRVARKAKRAELVGFDNVLVGALTGMITSVITEPVRYYDRNALGETKHASS